MSEFHAPRHATELLDSVRDTRWLKDWRGVDAYVLLGDPGAGKTSSFLAECQAAGGVWATARDVLAGVAPNVPQGGVVFIDGLDEVRAGEANGRVPFDQLRRWLNEQGRPRLRLSCREADWLGHADLRELAKVTPNGEVRALHLEPLQDEDILTILVARSSEVPDAQAFLRTAEQTGLTPLLRNPLMLDLAIRGQSAWFAQPDLVRQWSRSDIYRAACEQLAVEHNPEHSAVATPCAPGGVQQVLDAAGWLSAVLLLSGKAGVSEAGPVQGDEGVPLALLPPAPDVTDGVMHMALRSKLFSTRAGLRAPLHRTVAEYLAAGFLAKRINLGLPLGRVMALMQGMDGVPVEPLRGLWAWLAVQHLPARTRLMTADPIGFVLNGDAMVLTHDERLQLLAALRDAFAKDPWSRDQIWNTPLFGPLATPDMADALQVVLQDHSDDLGHQSLLTCVFDALRHGQALPSLAPILEAWVEDGQAGSYLRTAAYRAGQHCTGWQPQQALAWLHAIQAGSLPDDEDELCGMLLADLYPAHVTPSEVLGYWHEPKRPHFFGAYKHFWHFDLFRQAPDSAWTELVEGWRTRHPFIQQEEVLHSQFELPARLLANALPRVGEQLDSEVLYDWLGLCLDEYGESRWSGISELKVVQTWLSNRPQRMKDLFRIGLLRTEQDAHGHWPFWQIETRLHDARHPPDWLHWLLEVAADAPTPEAAEYCFFPAARAAIKPISGMDSPSLEEIEEWVERHRGRWPMAEDWKTTAWSVSLDHWESKQARRRRERETELLHRTAARQTALQPHWQALLDGSAPARLLYNVAVAHEHGFSDLQGETPLQRVQDLLVCDETQARAVLAALPKVLTRDDLPTVADILKLETQGKHPLIRPALLLAARMVHEQDPSAPLYWPQSLVEKLLACYLTEGTVDMPLWYTTLVQHRPSCVANVLVRYAAPKLKQRTQTDPVVAELRTLGEADHAQLAQQALPDLLQAVPLKASEAVRRILNRALLPALAALPEAQAKDLVRNRLERGGMDPGQTMAWLVADLPYRAPAAADLAAMVGHNERRAVMLGEALHEQGGMKRMLPRLAPSALQHLIAVLAPITKSDRWGDNNGDFVTGAEDRSDTVHALCSALSSNPSAEAAQALAALKQAPGMGPWQTALAYGLRTQAVVAREAQFQVPSSAAVAQVLSNQAPAHALDLRELVVQHLQDLQASWRGRDVFALKQFWRVAPNGQQQPLTENDCRDLVLEKLRERLGVQNIGISSEHRAAQDKRADMCAEYLHGGRRISVPVEVKKADHKDLWTAWRDQLQRLYAIDPDAQGCGLYLVLWFGERWRKMHPEGQPMNSAGALQKALDERIPTADRHRLTVLVMDLSWPNPHPDN